MAHPHAENMRLGTKLAYIFVQVAFFGVVVGALVYSNPEQALMGIMCILLHDIHHAIKHGTPGEGLE